MRAVKICHVWYILFIFVFYFVLSWVSKFNQFLLISHCTRNLKYGCLFVVTFFCSFLDRYFFFLKVDQFENWNCLLVYEFAHFLGTHLIFLTCSSLENKLSKIVFICLFLNLHVQLLLTHFLLWSRCESVWKFIK